MLGGGKACLKNATESRVPSSIQRPVFNGPVFNGSTVTVTKGFAPTEAVMVCIGMAMLMMAIVATAALVHRAAMGGAQEPLGSRPKQLTRNRSELAMGEG